MLTKSKSFLYIVLALAAGVALLLLPGSGGTESKTVSAPWASEYTAALEKKGASLIGELDGVKDCSVAITLAAGYEYLYASDGRISHTYDESGALLGDEETREYIFAATDGNTQPVVISERMPTVEGVAVVCKGATAVTEQKIISLLSALFNIKSNKISVITQ